MHLAGFGDPRAIAAHTHRLWQLAGSAARDRIRGAGAAGGTFPGRGLAAAALPAQPGAALRCDSAAFRTAQTASLRAVLGYLLRVANAAPARLFAQAARHPQPARRLPARACAARGAAVGRGAAAGSVGRAGGRAGPGRPPSPPRRRAELGGRWRRRLGPFKATPAVTRSPQPEPPPPPAEHPAPGKGLSRPRCCGEAWRRRGVGSPAPRCGGQGGRWPRTRRAAEGPALAGRGRCSPFPPPRGAARRGSVLPSLRQRRAVPCAAPPPGAPGAAALAAPTAPSTPVLCLLPQRQRVALVRASAASVCGGCQPACLPACQPACLPAVRGCRRGRARWSGGRFGRRGALGNARRGGSARRLLVSAALLREVACWGPCAPLRSVPPLNAGVFPLPVAFGLQTSCSFEGINGVGKGYRNARLSLFNL